MRIAPDIRTLIENDAKRLTQAFTTGEISLPMSDTSDSHLQILAADIIRYQLESRMLSLVLPYLSTMRWLSLQEACIYARKSRNSLLELIKNGKIYGTKPEGTGDYILDRLSIDKFFEAERDERRLQLARQRRIS